MRTFIWSQWHVTTTAVVFGVALTGVGLWKWRGRNWPASWWLTTLGGVALACSPVHLYAMDSYGAHMAEHLLVVFGLAPLAVIAWRPAPMSRSASTSAFLLLVALMPVYHLTGIGGLVMRSVGNHVLELALFAIVGVLFWRGPYGGTFTRMERVSYIGLALPISIFSGVALSSASRAPFALMDMTTPLRDVHRGGLIMAEMSVVLLALHLVLALLWPRSS